MHSRHMTPWRKLALCSLLLTVLTGCKSMTPPKPEILHDSNVPIPEVYDKDGKLIVGYQGYSDGFVAHTLKVCNAMMDKAGIH